MITIWHLVKTDLRRLRLPLAWFALLMVGKLVFYASIAGVLGGPDVDWLNRLNTGPELLLRALLEPLFGYFLVGWLVFADPPAERNAHWITRPISGSQLFAAKLITAGGLFVLLPLALHIPWWLAAGQDWPEIALSVVELAGAASVLVAIGLACAALTDGFPRFVLWSLIGFAAIGMLSLVAPGGGTGPGVGVSRFLIGLGSAGVFAMAIAAHQFVTRRHRKSLGLLVAGIVTIGCLSGVWRWNLTNARETRRAAEAPGAQVLRVQLGGPVEVRRSGARQFAQLDLQLSNVPAESVVSRIRATGEWSFQDVKAWSSQATVWGDEMRKRAAQRLLGSVPAETRADHVMVSLPLATPLLERAAREPVAFRAGLEIDVFRQSIVAELPLQADAPLRRAGLYTISHVSTGPWQESRRRKETSAAPEPQRAYVAVGFTERTPFGILANAMRRRFNSYCFLVNRVTGEIVHTALGSGPVARARLSQIAVSCEALNFQVNSAPVRLEEWKLVVLQLDRGETVRRTLHVDPIQFGGEQAPNSQSATPAPAPNSARMRELVDAHAASDRFMGSVLVAKDGAVVFEHSTGWADLTAKVPNSPATRFRIGSVTKQFTAAAILLLEERGRLAVDDPLSKFVPAVPEAWRAVTLRHLLTHTSGIPNFTSLPEHATWKWSPQTPAQLIERIGGKPLDFAPGERFKYSNSGYVLLGWVVALASGQSYDTFLREQIFSPLGMNDSGYDSNAPERPRHAAGYMPGNGGPVAAAAIDMQVPGGAGALYSTTGDLLRWTSGLFGGKLLTAASLEKMTTPFKKGYAFGVGVSSVNARKIIAHNGGIDGFNSVLAYYPESKTTVVVLANIDGSPYAELADQLAAVAFGETVILTTERKEIEVPTAVLQRYVGVYRLSPEIMNTVRLVDGRLTTQLSGQPAFLLFPESEQKFFLKIVDAQVEFVADEQGRITHLLQHQAGRTQTAPRISDTVRERETIVLPRTILETYVGVYELKPGAHLAITLEGDELMIEPPGQRKTPLFAETESAFFSKAVDAQAEFFKAANGTVTHLIVRVGNREMRAPRVP